MIRAKNYETVSKFVTVMTKILWPLFFPDTVYMHKCAYTIPCLQCIYTVILTTGRHPAHKNFCFKTPRKGPLGRGFKAEIEAS